MCGKKDVAKGYGKDEELLLDLSLNYLYICLRKR